MPEEFREQQRKISNMDEDLIEEIIEEIIEDYYEQIENPYGNDENLKKIKYSIFLPLVPVGIMFD